MSETSQTSPLTAAPVTFCGCPGRLEPVGESSLGADGCWVWHTDGGVLSGPVSASLFTLACDVAELYHQRRTLQLSAVPGVLEVIWLELTTDNSLLVFLKPVSHTSFA